MQVVPFDQRDLGPRLSATTASINNSLNIYKNRADSNSIQLDTYRDEQYEYEEKLLQITSICPIETLGSIRDRLGSLDPTQLQMVISKQIQNPEAMMATLCVTDSILYTSPYDGFTPIMNERIRNYIKNLKQIGAESAEGYAMLADLKNAKDFFIIKTARNPQTDLLLHELIVGLFGANKMRKYIPNFMYTFGGFKCSPPLINPANKKVVTWCLNNENPVNYVVLENITNAVPFGNYIKSCTVPQFLNIFMQTMYALKLGVKICDFTHYDLHTDNILVRTVSSTPFQVAYPTENGEEYITTDKIGVIIDYGFSQIRIGDVISSQGVKLLRSRNVGRNNMLPYSIFPYRSWFMFDVYKLLMFSMLSASRSNNQAVFSETVKIFRFFNQTESPEAVLNQQWVHRFSLPFDSITQNFDIDNFLSYVRRNCDCSFIGPKDGSIPSLNCETMCLTKSQTLTAAKVNPSDPIVSPTTINDFFFVSRKLLNEGRMANYQNLTEVFRAYYPTAMADHITMAQKEINEVVNLSQTFRTVNLSRMPLNQLFSDATVNAARSAYVTGGEIIDKTAYLKFYYESAIYTAKLYKDYPMVDRINALFGKFQEYVTPGIQGAKAVILVNDQYLESIKNDPQIQAALQAQPQYLWYWQGRKLFDLVYGRDILTQIDVLEPRMI